MILTLITISWIFISAICLWVLIEQRKKPIFLFFFIPAFLLLTSSTYFTVRGLLGYTTEEMPKKKFTYISHLSDAPVRIFYWLMLDGESMPRAFIVPYTQQDKNNADKARGLKEAGIWVQGELSIGKEQGESGESEKGKGGFTTGGALEFYKFDHTLTMPKDIPLLVEPKTL